MTNQRIENRNATIARHSAMTCKTIEIKIDTDKLTKKQQEQACKMFTQGKYCTNHYISQHRDGAKWSEIDTKPTMVPVLTPDGYDNRSVSAVAAGIRQGILERIKSNESSRITNEVRGNNEHGELHFIKQLDSLPLKQYGKKGLYRIDFEQGKVFVSKLGWMKAYGLEQIPKDDKVEISSGVLLRKNSGLYIHATIYIPIAIDMIGDYLEDFIGLDFGVSCSVTTSDGETLDWFFGETPALKEAQCKNQAFRDWSEKAEGKARNSNKQISIIHREYELLDNRKDDAANKVVNYLLSTYKYVVIQDESLSEWAKTYGSKVQHSIMGRIIKKLKEHENRIIIVNKYQRTTGVCDKCGAVVPDGLPLDVREWVCPECHAVHHRDVSAASAIKLIGVGDLVPHLLECCPKSVALEDSVPF